MRSLPLLALLLAATPLGQAQVRLDSALAERQHRTIRTAGITVAGLAGYAIGGAAGYYAGLATDPDFIPDNLLSGHGLVGIPIGGTLGTVAAVHLANGRRGNVGLNLAATGAAQALWILVASQLAEEPAGLLVIGTPLVGVGVSVAVERLTTPRRR